jgi:transcriptional regulator with XRE-family HTH domain
MSTSDHKNICGHQPIKAIFAKRLQEAINQKGANPESVATKMTESGSPISPQLIRVYLKETGTMPSAERLLWFADFFGKSMDWFFCRDAKMSTLGPSVPSAETVTDKLLRQTKEVLASEDQEIAEALRSNIKAFHKAVTHTNLLTKNMEVLRAQIDELKTEIAEIKGNPRIAPNAGTDWEI